MTRDLGIDDYQRGAIETIAYDRESESEALQNALIELVSEVGEITDLWKEYRRGRITLKAFQDALPNETADVVWGCMAVLHECGVQASDALRDNREKLSRRKEDDALFDRSHR